jgi:3-hydroxy acid dehydrogenase/malonic semialdehyde reductase
MYTYSLQRIFRTATALSKTSPLSNPLRPHLAQLRHTLHQHANMSSASRLKGKTVLITGASSGIGKSSALEFARTQPDDLKLILTARRIDTLNEVAKEIGGFAKGVKVHAVKLDVSKPEKISALVGNLPEEFKEIDVLVNNA